jgi:hypothetical protein
MRLLLAASLVLLPMAGKAQAVTVQPHRAIYDLKLLRASDNSGITGVDGRLAFEVNGSPCEGWTVNFRMVNEYIKSEGDPRLVDTQSTSFESGDSHEMQYSDREFVNNKPESESRVRAARDNPDGAGHGEYGTTDKKPFDLPGGVLFPIQHQLKVTREAEEGQTRDVSVLFDGSDNSTAYKVVTFISPQKAAGQNGRDLGNPAAAALAKMASWPVSMSYYKVSTEESDTPSYQVSFDLYDNGVATGLTLDYGDFVLQGDLVNLDYLDTKSCP